MDQPDYRPFARPRSDDRVTTLEWLFVHFILFVPFFNLFALLYWSVSSRTQPSKQSYARSILLSLAALLGGLYLLWKSEAARGFAQGPVLDKVVELVRHEADHYHSEAPRYRTFTDPEGRSIEAKVEGFVGSKVLIQRRNGQRFETEFARFSSADRDYLLDLRTRMEAAGKAEDD